ncbi:hypothetical protein [[Limnothrix rosea] IAM M-220]|uniref:hypothetical protein n=1 Tax=[Limnothrix rosea] IAM M-220 TaxID=454133 RepID=UPI00095F0A66|nr:hypothetical protein [[Limnothrix rosea] IAM M-220]OKH17653.1 hypothetical protein NIES208_08340 [[Limnothrix rosea] IAM M-220]
MTKKHFFRSEENSPLQQILEDIKQSEGRSFQKELEDTLLILYYPHLLHKQGASSEQVCRQAEISIRRLHQEITHLTALINSVSSTSSILDSGEEQTDLDMDDAESKPFFTPQLFAKNTF